MIVELITGAQTSANYWKQERLVLSFETRDVNTITAMWTNLHGSSASPLARYKATASGSLTKCLVDMTDYVRAYPSVTHIYLQNNDDTFDVVVSVKGLINPAGVIIPPHDLEAYNALILPPTKILFDGTQEDLSEHELYTTAGTWNVRGNASLSGDKRVIGQISGNFTLTDGTHEKTYAPQLLNPCSRYALVKWVSFTGLERTAWYEVKKERSAVADNYELLPVDNEYIEIKGREDGFIIWLDGLDAYDLWYYADVVLSSKVEVSLDGGQTFERVQVTTKEIETPDFANDGKVEITVNWKRYDAVAM